MAKTFLGALFTKVICTFLKSVRKDGFFYAPLDLFKEKKFSSLRRDIELFCEKRFFINRSYIFIALPKFYVTLRIYEILSKSLVPTPHTLTGNWFTAKTTVHCSSDFSMHKTIQCGCHNLNVCLANRKHSGCRWDHMQTEPAQNRNIISVLNAKRTRLQYRTFIEYEVLFLQPFWPGFYFW